MLVNIAVAKKKHDSAGIVTTQAVGASQLLKTSPPYVSREPSSSVRPREARSAA